MRQLTFAWISLLLVASSAAAAAAHGRSVTVISGIVREQGGSPLEGVLIHVKGADLSDVTTSPEGWFRFVVVDLPGEIPLRFSRTGFEDKALALQPQSAEIKLDIVLNKESSLAVRMTEFERGRRIRGTVSGFAPGEQEKLKVLVYVLTNKWYIHPEAVATPGLGFAGIDPAGQWEIGSVWRGHQAIKLALLVVPKDAWAPPTVEPGEIRPEDTLRSRLAPLAISVIEAPAGI